MKNTILLILLSMSFTFAQASNDSEKLLDKIVAVINSRVISLSEIQRMSETLEARKEISPIIYTEKFYSQKELLEIMLRAHIIRDKLNAQGYIINDDAVESRIKMTEERLGLKRSDLLQFLKGKGVTYEEYFEIIRETMEFNVFAQRIIAPLITVTEQEVKNEYYRRNSMNNALSFKYTLVDFYIPKNKILGEDYSAFLAVLKDYQLTGKLPEEFKNLESNNLENLSEDGLSKELASLLKSTSEGSFSNPISLNDLLHVFYVQKKDLVESQDFLKIKDDIQNDLFTNKGKSVTTNWFDREYSNYYIKNLL